MPVELERPELFRRRRFEAPHRRRGWLLRLTRPFLLASIAVGVPAAAAFWMLTSPTFALREITVGGVDRVPEAWVRQALRPLEGRHLLWVRLPEVEARLTRHPWIRGVIARKELPHSLTVELEERRPEALLRRGGGLFYIDRDGFEIGPFDPTLGDADLPLLSGIGEPAAQAPEALEVVRRWQRSRPEWAAGLSEVERLGRDDFRVYSSSVPFPVRVGSVDLELGLDRLSVLLPRIVERLPETAEVDLRFSHQVVIKGVALPRSQEG